MEYRPMPAPLGVKAVLKSSYKKRWVRYVKSYYPKVKAKEILEETKDKYK